MLVLHPILLTERGYPDDYDKIKGNPSLTVIGHMTEANEGMSLVTRANQKIELTAQGWDSLLKKTKSDS
jgi:thiamine-monophosphate kinase